MRKGVVFALALLALTTPTGALTQERQSTAFTLQSGQERTSEQTTVRFDQADLSIKVIPDLRRIEGVAVLDFTATTATIYWMQLELDSIFFIEEIAVDGVDLHPDDNWRNDDGRLVSTSAAIWNPASRSGFASSIPVSRAWHRERRGAGASSGPPPRPANPGSPRRSRARAATSSGPASTTR